MDRQIQNLGIRVERLEAQSRRIKLIAGAVVVVLSVLLVAGQTSVKQPRTSRVVEAEEFILRDKNGKKRGWWTVGADDSSIFVLLNREEKAMAFLVEEDDNSRLIVGNSRGAVAVLAAREESTSVKLSGSYQQPSSEWLMESDGHVSFALRENTFPTEETKEQLEKVKGL